MKIYIVRHGQSRANTGEIIPNKQMPCNKIPLTDLGIKQARELGEDLKDIIPNCVTFHSPFLRTRQTAFHMLSSVYDDVKAINDINNYSQEEVRIREVDVGTGKFPGAERERGAYGWFYWRFPNGETPCEVYDRAASFFEHAASKALMEKKDLLLISHGMTIRALIMRALNLTVEDFNSMRNPDNCQLITIAAKETLQNPVFVNGNLGVEGIGLRTNRNDNSELMEM